MRWELLFLKCTIKVNFTVCRITNSVEILLSDKQLKMVSLRGVEPHTLCLAVTNFCFNVSYTFDSSRQDRTYEYSYMFRFPSDAFCKVCIG